MTEGLARKRQPPASNAPAEEAGRAPHASAVPICFVVDDEASIRHFLSLILHGSGLDTEEFADGASFRQAIDRRLPDLVFLERRPRLRGGDRMREHTRQASAISGLCN